MPRPRAPTRPRPRRPRRRLHNPIPVRDPDAELTALIQASPTSSTFPAQTPSHLDEEGFIEQSLASFASSDRTLLRGEEAWEDVVMGQTSEDAVLGEAEGDERSQRSRPLVSGRASPANSSGVISIKSALSSLANSLRGESRRGSMSSSRSNASATKSPVPTNVQQTGEEDNEPLEIIEGYWAAPVYRGTRRLNPNVFMPPPEGESEFGIPTNAPQTGEEDNEPLEIIEGYWAAPVYRGTRRLNPNVFMPPPEGKSEFGGEDDSDSKDHENAAQ